MWRPTWGFNSQFWGQDLKSRVGYLGAWNRALSYLQQCPCWKRANGFWSSVEPGQQRSVRWDLLNHLFTWRWFGIFPMEQNKLPINHIGCLCISLPGHDIFSFLISFNEWLLPKHWVQKPLKDVLFICLATQIPSESLLTHSYRVIKSINSAFADLIISRFGFGRLGQLKRTDPWGCITSTMSTQGWGAPRGPSGGLQLRQCWRPFLNNSNY